MLDLDERLFAGLIRNINLENKTLADIGCGTGRHWQNIYNKNPALVMGFDVSAGMLKQLKDKFPAAITQKTHNNLLRSIPDSNLDCIFSTLTIAHIRIIEEALGAWNRVLKTGGDLVITDFHPDMLEKGGKRSFQYEGKTLSVKNYVHRVGKIKSILLKHGFVLINEEEIKVDENVRSYYELKNAAHVFEQFRGMPIIYGLHLRKQFAAQ